MVIRFLRGEGAAGHEGEGLAEIGEYEVAPDRPFRLLVAPFGQRRHRLRPFLIAQRHCPIPPFPSAFPWSLIHAIAQKREALPPQAIRLYVAQVTGERQTLAPDAAEIERLADAAIARMPEPFRRHLDGVVLRVDDFAEDEVLAQFGIEDPFELSGLYTGRPIGEQSSMLSGELPAMIHLYRRPLLDEWAETGVSLEALVTHVIVHEAGHHFGFSDSDMHAIEAQAGQEAED